MNATCERLDEATAYVLGTLSPHQRERYGRHARTCEVCADELDLLNEAAFVPEVMVSRPVRPPSEHEHQHGPRRRPVHSEHVLGLTAAKHAQSGHGAGANGVHSRQSATRRRFGPPIPKPALTALVGLLVVAALTVYMSHRAVSTTYVRGTTAWPTPAGIALQVQGGRGELLVTHLPQAPAGQHYEIWALPHHSTTLQAVNATLKLNAKGQGGVKLPGDIHDYTAVGVYSVSGRSQTHALTVSDHPVAVVYVPAASAK